MTLKQELASLRESLTLEQHRFEAAGLTDIEVVEINESCGALRRQIRRLESSVYK